jgi:ribose transport system substrate-binding protein
MKKTFYLLGIILLITGFFASCGKNKPVDDEKIIIAVIPKIDNEIFAQVKQSAMQTGQNLGITVTWEAPSGIEGAKQKELIENLIHYGVDGILISCNDADLLREPINKAVEAGIKVGTFDSDCPGSKRTCYVGTDNKKAGKVCAETLLKFSEAKSKKPSQILVMSGSAGAPNMKERMTGFTSVVDQNNIGVVLYSFEMLDYGKELLTYNLKNNRKIDAVQLFWGLPVFNGIDSIPVLHDFMRRGGSAVFFDVSKPLLRYIAKTENCATMKQDFEAMGRDGVTNLFNAIKSASYEQEILYDVVVINKNNAAQELEKMK